MPLFMIVHEIDAQHCVVIVESGTKLYARLAVGLAGFGGTFVSVHEFEPAQARKIGKKMVGRVLSQKEMETLVKRLGRARAAQKRAPAFKPYLLSPEPA